jgi:hypothetical protein
MTMTMTVIVIIMTMGMAIVMIITMGMGIVMIITVGMGMAEPSEDARDEYCAEVLHVRIVWVWLSGSMREREVNSSNRWLIASR